MEGQMDRLKDEWNDGRRNGSTQGRTDDDRRKEGQKV